LEGFWAVAAHKLATAQAKMATLLRFSGPSSTLLPISHQHCLLAHSHPQPYLSQSMVQLLEPKRMLQLGLQCAVVSRGVERVD
jgi:hypothetical protein